MNGSFAGELTILTVCNPISAIFYVGLTAFVPRGIRVCPFDQGLGCPVVFI